MSARIAQLEGRNQELVLIQDEDKRALIQLDDRCKLYQAELEQFCQSTPEYFTRYITDYFKSWLVERDGNTKLCINNETQTNLYF